MKTLTKLAMFASAIALAAPAQAAPTFWTPNFGAAVFSADDNTSGVTLNALFPLYNNNYATGTLSSNGFIQFGGSNGSECCNGSIGLLLAGFPRISVLWTDLVGTVFQNNDTPGQTVFTWQGTEYASGGSYASQLTLFNDGRFVMGWDGPSVINGHSTLTGVSPGGNAPDPGGSNLSAFTSPTATGNTVYELFPAQTFDLNQKNLYFTPTANGFSVNAIGFDSAVPEPATWLLMIIGFGLVGGALRRRRQVVRVSYA